MKRIKTPRVHVHYLCVFQCIYSLDEANMCPKMWWKQKVVGRKNMPCDYSPQLPAAGACGLQLWWDESLLPDGLFLICSKNSHLPLSSYTIVTLAHINSQWQVYACSHGQSEASVHSLTWTVKDWCALIHTNSQEQEYACSYLHSVTFLTRELDHLL